MKRKPYKYTTDQKEIIREKILDIYNYPDKKGFDPDFQVLDVYYLEDGEEKIITAEEAMSINTDWIGINATKKNGQHVQHIINIEGITKIVRGYKMTVEETIVFTPANVKRYIELFNKKKKIDEEFDKVWKK